MTVTVAVLEERINHLVEMHEENKEEIERLKSRLNAYDKLAAKWGGVCLAATFIGGFVMTYVDKLQEWLRR